MPEIRSFRGIRYNIDAVGDLSLVVAPPYDIIDEKARDNFYNRHPYNVVRLILNRPMKSDKDPEQPYKRAASFFERWLAQRVLIQDFVPSIYLYRQRYILEGEYKECTGIVAKVRVEDLESGNIKPHEDIMPKPFEDRMKLLEHTMANFDLVHALYSDPPERLRDPILAELEKLPLAQFQTADGVWHDLWAVSDERFIKKIADFLRKKTLYIADGHHRYQTALEYQKRLAERGELGNGEDPRRYLLMMIVEMENPGLSLLAVHRVILNSKFRLNAEFFKAIDKLFTVTKLGVPTGSRSGQIYAVLNELKEHYTSGCAFGLFSADPEEFLLLKLKSGVDVSAEIGGDSSRDYQNLDVTILHKLIIEKVLGIPQVRGAVEKNLLFTRDPIEAARIVDSGKGSMVFFVNPTRIEQVKAIADNGERMPQKSTYFYPKPCSGVVMCRITEF